MNKISDILFLFKLYLCGHWPDSLGICHLCATIEEEEEGNRCSGTGVADIMNSSMGDRVHVGSSAGVTSAPNS